MEELWHKVCNHFAVPEDVAQSWYTRIYQRLNERHSKRYYHNWNEMMQHKCDHLQHCKPALVLAAFFQYYSYDGIQPFTKENCAAFEEFCCDASLDDQESKNLILKLLGDKSAENELETTFEDDANFLQDLDLAILAANSENYKRYCQLLRMEYDHMSDENYKNMRLKVLQTLLSIPNIFSTTDFQTRYEAAARSNMKDEISTLKANETPTTSTNRKRRRFNKFRDNTKRRLQLRNKRLSRSTTNGNITSSSQRVTKKLLRVIRRRQLHNQNKAKQLQRSLKTKLNLVNKCVDPTSNLDNLSLEEGEIISDDEVTNVNLTANTSAANDDDCIWVEPQIEQIIIDDDLPDTSLSKTRNNKSFGYVSIIQRINERGIQANGNLLTSTPCGGAAARSSSKKNEEDFSDLINLFYEDVSGISTLDTIRSEDTFSNYAEASRVGGNRKSNSKNRRRNKRKNYTVTSKDVIILDDTVNDSTLRPETDSLNSRKDEELENSVIFISETTRKSDRPASALDFVPLCSNDVPNPIVVPVSPPRVPKRAAVNSGLFTTSEKKALLAYNNNTYNPNAGDPKAPEKQTTKRLILIDGCNVAFNHALNRQFSVKGLKICIDYFEKMGHEVKAVVPQFRMHKCTDSAAMFELHRTGKIVITPCKNLPGKFTISYDDRFVLQLAAEMDAAIVSNDNYRDLINENAAFKKLIENRVIGFTWCNDLFMVAKDPYGKWGPSLQTILNRT